MHKYRLISKKGEGTFSEVLKAQSIKSNKYLAIKCLKNSFESIEQVNNLREIQALRRLSPNPGIIKLYEVLYDQPTGRLALVFELMSMNIYELIRGRRHYLPEDRVKHYMYQLMKAMDHMHRQGIFHRDIKPENILISDDVLKVADFGSCRGIYSKQPYTEYISTRWYRAPECLLTDGYYGYKMDIWGVGCVMFEIIALFPLFPGTNELNQVERIHNILGTPPAEVLNKFKKYATHMEFNFPPKTGTGIAKLIPHANETCIDLIVKLLAYDPEDRLSARQALRHPYFAELRQADKRAEKEKAALAAATNAGAAASSVAGAPSTNATGGTKKAGSKNHHHHHSAEVSAVAPTKKKKPHSKKYQELPNVSPQAKHYGEKTKGGKSSMPLPSISNYNNNNNNIDHDSKARGQDVAYVKGSNGKYTKVSKLGGHYSTYNNNNQHDSAGSSSNNQHHESSTKPSKRHGNYSYGMSNTSKKKIPKKYNSTNYNYGGRKQQNPKYYDSPNASKLKNGYEPSYKKTSTNYQSPYSQKAIKQQRQYVDYI